MKWLCTADSEETCHYLHQSKSSEHYDEVQPTVKRQLMLVVYYLYPTNPLWTDNYHFPGRSLGKKNKHNPKSLFGWESRDESGMNILVILFNYEKKGSGFCQAKSHGETTKWAV